MIRWDRIAPALVRLFSRLAVDAQTAVEWADNPIEAQWAEKKRGFTHPLGIDLLLRVSAVTRIGEDERRYEEVTNGLVETIVGQRRITLEVRVDSLDHDEEHNEWCWSIVERVRSKLKLRSTIDELMAVNVAVIEDGGATDVTFDFDGRRENSATLEVVLATAIQIKDEAHERTPLGWIERIRLTAKTVGGQTSAVPSPPAVTDLLVDITEP